MNAKIIHGKFHSVKDTYLAKDGVNYFGFKFVNRGSIIDIFCTKHPSFNGQDSDPHKTHLYRSGKLCFKAGKEPKSQSRAKELAAQWAEYFLEYRRTGKPQY